METTTISDQQWEALKERARKLGTEHGKNAASWYEVNEQNASKILEGIKDCDPLILDTFPTDGLSGEWADSFTSRDLEKELDVDDSFGDLGDAYMDAFASAVESEIERRALFYVQPV